MRSVEETVNSAETPAAPPKRWHRRLWFVLAGVALALVALVGACAVALSSLSTLDGLGNLNFNIDPNATPGIYKPIPVAARACPYLRDVHDTAERAGNQWVSATLGDSTRVKRRTVRRTLGHFKSALRTAMPHVPRKVKRQLRATLAHVERGERELLRSATVNAYGVATVDAVTEGNRALGNASDLVGNACGFRLKPRIDWERATGPASTSNPGR